jgi:hypothetical protein
MLKTDIVDAKQNPQCEKVFKPIGYKDFLAPHKLNFLSLKELILIEKKYIMAN